jgi:hypothetical protein
MKINSSAKEAIAYLSDEFSTKRSYLTMRIHPGLLKLFLNERDGSDRMGLQ